MNAALRRDVIVSASIIGGSLLLFFIAFIGLRARMTGNVEDIARANTSIVAQAQAAETLARLKQDAPLAAEYDVKLRQLLPKNEELIGVMRAIDAVARAHNVTFHFAFQGGGTVGSAGAAGTVPFSLEAEGSYESVKNFFSDLESKSSRFLMQFGTFRLEAVAGGYKMSSVGSVYYRM